MRGYILYGGKSETLKKFDQLKRMTHYSWFIWYQIFATYGKDWNGRTETHSQRDGKTIEENCDLSFHACHNFTVFLKTNYKTRLVWSLNYITKHMCFHRICYNIIFTVIINVECYFFLILGGFWQNTFISLQKLLLPLKSTNSYEIIWFSPHFTTQK